MVFSFNDFPYNECYVHTISRMGAITMFQLQVDHTQFGFTLANIKVSCTMYTLTLPMRLLPLSQCYDQDRLMVFFSYDRDTMRSSLVIRHIVLQNV